MAYPNVQRRHIRHDGRNPPLRSHSHRGLRPTIHVWGPANNLLYNLLGRSQRRTTSRQLGCPRNLRRRRDQQRPHDPTLPDAPRQKSRRELLHHRLPRRLQRWHSARRSVESVPQAEDCQSAVGVEQCRVHHRGAVAERPEPLYGPRNRQQAGYQCCQRHDGSFRVAEYGGEA